MLARCKEEFLWLVWIVLVGLSVWKMPTVPELLGDHFQSTIASSPVKGSSFHRYRSQLRCLQQWPGCNIHHRRSQHPPTLVVTSPPKGCCIIRWCHLWHRWFPVAAPVTIVSNTGGSWLHHPVVECVISNTGGAGCSTAGRVSIIVVVDCSPSQWRVISSNSNTALGQLWQIACNSMSWPWQEGGGG